MRKKFVAGNWKLNTSKTTAVDLARAVAAGVKPGDPRVAVCPPAVYLGIVAEAVKGTPVEVGGQNAYSAATGAFTGENSPAMIKELGCSLVILGHSERRQYFGETNEGVNQKTKAAFDQGLDPIVCVGETLQERQAGKTFEILKSQLLGSMQGLPTDKLPRLVLAYEPVWAIGTGVNATPEQAQEAHAFLRGLVRETFGSSLADGMVILYGGSVKADNAATLFSQPDVDGGLIGGASLDPKGFLQIVAAARS